MKRLLLLVSIALMPGVLACGDLSDADAEEILAQIREQIPIPNLGQPLSQEPDEDIQAAGAAPEATEKIRQADRLLEQALESREPGPVSEAVELRPRDPSLRLYQAAMMVAYGNRSESRRALGEAAGLIYPPAAWDEERDSIIAQDIELTLGYLDALLRTMQAFESGTPERYSLRIEYCKWHDIYDGFTESLLRKFNFDTDSSRYPSEACR
ncbi:MAG TPA: hypothetical protein VFS30_05145 [Dehalococcoidia bacterium]|nr:hypothetical protein [Dehalococcoidia bacterium]